VLSLRQVHPIDSHPRYRLLSGDLSPQISPEDVLAPELTWAGSRAPEAVSLGHNRL